MMSDLIAALFLLGGGFFCFVAGLGLLRLPDVYCRMHAATKAGTVGLALVCLAAIVKSTSWTEILQALFVFLFMIATAPIGAHLIGRAAFRKHTETAPGTQSDPGTEAFDD